MATVRLDMPARTVRAEVEKLARPFLMRVATQIANRAAVNAPVDQGHLRASKYVTITTRGDTLNAEIGFSAPHATFVHEGTGIFGPSGQPIRPKSGRFLVWPAKNNSGAGSRRYKSGSTATHVFARQVRGMKGRPFLMDAVDATRI